MSDDIGAYQNSVSRLEPNISLMDKDATLTSLAISVKRMADSMEGFVKLIEELKQEALKDK